MKKKKEKGFGIKTTYTPMIIVLCITLLVLPILLTSVLYMLNIRIGESISFGDTFLNNAKEIAILTLAITAWLGFTLSKMLSFGKPKETKTLASSEWKSPDEQKKFKDFAIAPIDVNQELPVGGSPVNMIDPDHLIYETGFVHDLCVGSTRSGKSRKLVRQLVMLAIMAKESMIFNDPKKEMYQDFHILLEKMGYDVYSLDFRMPEYSNAWNPMEDISYMFELGNVDDADQYASDQVTSLVVDNGQSEPIWIDGQKALIKALLLEVAQAPIPKEKKNYYSVVQMLSLLGKEVPVGEKPKMLLTVYMNSLDEMSPSRVAYTPISTSPEKTRGSFMTSALATLSPFTGIKIAKVLAKSDFNFHDFDNEKKALFITNPDEKTTYNAITAMAFDNAYQALIFEANKNSGRRLKKRVHMILDEFGNMPKINNLQQKITVALSRGILYHLYLQDFKQMNEIYGDNVAAIIRGNCNLKYFISSADYATCEEMSQLFGNKTLWVSNQGGNYDQNANATGANVGYNQQQRRLQDANELMSSDTTNGHGIKVYRTYLGPMEVDLPDASAYKWYDLMEHDEKEKVNEDLSLSYAVPRYIVIDDMTLKSHHRRMSGSGFGPNQAQKKIDERDIFWYWSTRNDLEEPVISKITDYFMKNDLTYANGNARRRLIKDYLKSENFIQWLWSIDQEDREPTEEEVETVDMITSREPSQLEDFFN